MADKSLNLVWIKSPNMEQFSRVADQIDRSPLFTDPAVKCETASSAVAAFLDAYRDLIWGMRWLLSPAILVTLSLVISNAISISVRERRLEMAVLKVLGFRPGQLLILVLGEALLIGVLAGLASAGATYFIVNYWIGGIAFPIGFFPKFFIPTNAFWWGLGIGTVTSLAGSIMPAWNARSVHVAEVFSKIA
jgi:putative ABC transport system permease protein